MNKIMSGKDLANKKIETFSERITILKKKGITPNLVVVLIGNNSSSKSYVKNKMNYCSKVGLDSKTIELSENITMSELLDIIQTLNVTKTVHGILVQFPLPKHIDEFTVKCAIDPKKDVDCFHPENVGLFYMNKHYTSPCTPSGVIEILKESNVNVEGKKALILGRSLIAGKPMAELLNQLNATTTIAHSYTNKETLTKLLKESDIIVSAVGKAKFIDKTMIGKNQVLIDIGICFDEQTNSLCGDFNHDCYEDALCYTPVPGGVGPMTVAMLIENTIKCAENSI